MRSARPGPSPAVRRFRFGVRRFRFGGGAPASGDLLRQSWDAAYRRAVRWGAAMLSLAMLSSIVAGCDRTVTKDDCDRVGTHMRKVWDAEARGTAPKGEPANEKAVTVIKSEGDRMSRDWIEQCKKELEGQRVDDRELECLLGAQTIAAVQECGTEKR